MDTDPTVRGEELRPYLLRDNKILVVDYTGTLEGQDTSIAIETMPLVGTEHHPFRTKVGVKKIDSVVARAYGLESVDTRLMSADEIEAIARTAEFDDPLWFKHSSGFKMHDLNHYNVPFLFQVAGCNFHDGLAGGGCWYCFVDDESNDGNPKGKVYLGIDETIDSALAARKQLAEFYSERGQSMDLKVLRMSGGEPTIVLDWLINLWDRIAERGESFAGLMDTNLSTSRLIQTYEKSGVFPKDSLRRLAEHNVRVRAAFKGVDAEDIRCNVQSTATDEDQRNAMVALVDAGFDVYPQLYNPNPEGLATFLACMDTLIQGFSAKVHIGPLSVYSPTTERLTLEARAREIDPEKHIAARKKEWQERYERSCEILDRHLRLHHGIGYKAITRADIELVVNK